MSNLMPPSKPLISHLLFRVAIPLLAAVNGMMDLYKPVMSQLNQICGEKPGFVRLNSWLGHPTGFGGNYETEICARPLEGFTSLTMVIEIRGKDANGMGIYMMNCENPPNGLWTAALTVHGSQATVSEAMPQALSAAARRWC